MHPTRNTALVRRSGEYPATQPLEWQPTDTAPTDGTRFLASQDKGEPFIAAYLEEEFRDPWTHQEVRITGWMPLPEAAE